MSASRGADQREAMSSRPGPVGEVLFFFFCSFFPFFCFCSFFEVRAATRVQETPCARLTTSPDTILIRNILPVETVEDETKWCSAAGTPTRNKHFYHVLFSHTHTHTGGRPVLPGFLQREKIRQKNFTELSVHFSVKQKRKRRKRRASGSQYFCCFLVCVFLRKRLSFCQ